MEKPELYFPTANEWRKWLAENHSDYPQGVYLIFYKVAHETPSMRWEEAVKVAICYGWIDSTVKNLGDGKRRQYFCPRNPKSTWSALNKKYVEALEAEGLIHKKGYEVINLAKETGTWSAMNDVEKGVIPKDLQKAFNNNQRAFKNFQSFSPSYRKSYLSWLHSAKRETTRTKRISEIIQLCDQGIKSRS